MNEDDKALVPIEQREVVFYEDEITAVVVHPPEKDEPEIFVPIRPICDFLGVSFAGQRERINRDTVLSESTRFVRVTRTNTGGGNPNMLAIPLEFMPGWLFGISASRVKENLRPKIIRYQRECFRVLWEAFQTRRLTSEEGLMQRDSPAVQAYHLAVAVADLARNQVLMEARMSERLDEQGRRIDEIESVLGDPGRHVTPEQASQISQAVKAVAMQLSKTTGRNEYGGVYGELYRKFGITSYKLLPAKKFDEAMGWLGDWFSSLTDQVVPF